MKTENLLNSKDEIHYVAVRVPFNEEEADRFYRFMKSTGRKAAPYIKQLLLEDMNREEVRA